METTIKKGVYLSFITQERWLKRTRELTGEDLRQFVSECQPISIASPTILKLTLGITKEELLSLGYKMEPEFNPNTDYYVIRRDTTRPS